MNQDAVTRVTGIFGSNLTGAFARESEVVAAHQNFGVENNRDVLSLITAILPAFNEEVSVGSMVLLTKKYADRVIVVDDGSNDRTAEVARLAGAEVIRHPVNRGRGAALKTGFESVDGAEVIVTLDSDGQHNPDDIPNLVNLVLSGEADMVNGSRYLNGEKKDTPYYRRVGQIVLDTATNLNSGLKVTDSQSGFRAFARQTISAFRFKQQGLAIESEMLADASRAGLRIKEVEIGVRYDVDCSTEHPVAHGIRVLVNVLHDMELRRPLYYFTVPGTVMTMLGVVMGLEFLRTFYNGGSLYFGPTLLMVMLTLAGSFMSMVGILLHTMSKLIKESKRENERSQTYEYHCSAWNPTRDL